MADGSRRRRVPEAVLYLPCGFPCRRRPPNHGRPHEFFEPPSVLVVDDEPQIQRLLKLTLESMDSAPSWQPEDGRRWYWRPSFRPSVILLDLGLPDLTGRRFFAASGMVVGSRRDPHCAGFRNGKGGRLGRRR